MVVQTTSHGMELRCGCEMDLPCDCGCGMDLNCGCDLGKDSACGCGYLVDFVVVEWIP